MSWMLKYEGTHSKEGAAVAAEEAETIEAVEAAEETEAVESAEAGEATETARATEAEQLQQKAGVKFRGVDKDVRYERG